MTSVQFRARIRKSIANEALQIALDNNARRRVRARLTALETLPDPQERRQRAHAVRADIIAHLDEYLSQFIAQAEKNGIIVHRAKDAAEAVQIVLEIAHSHNTKLIAKSKSMVSEEIGLNRALEADGLRVVETDLGEYIVQLRHEKPAHILTPAVHLRRQDVGKLFARELGIPFTEDVPTLVATARKVLHQVFLTADIGISGVNFGVAETGTLCIVTNEGNGRMVTTVPPVHIALMGMERLVPTLDDLALLLSLLPRSATGQKLTAYTQLINAPRRDDEIDGARHRHLVIVDNGRTRMRNSPLYEALYCIRCGACLNACPVFREIGGHAYVGQDGSIAPYPGPIGSVVSPGLLGLPQFGHLAQASSLCGACKEACPVDIDLPKMLTRVRAGQTSEDSKLAKRSGVGLSFFTKTGLWAYGKIGSSAGIFSAAQRLAGLAARLLFPFSDWFRLPAFTGWGYSKEFPRPAFRSFRARFQYVETGNHVTENRHTEKNEAAHDIPVQTDLVQQFIEALTAVNGEIHRTSESELTEDLIEFLKQKDVQIVSSWDQIPGLRKTRLTESGFQLVPSSNPRSEAGITSATAAIAETGTLVIPSGAGQPLSTSLLPEIHIGIVRSSEIVSSLEEALKRREVWDSSATVLVTGPSRTADIEMTLTIGVHGPKELIVFIF